MMMAVSVVALSLLLFISRANLQQDPEFLFHSEGENCDFSLKDMDQADYDVLYRRSAEGDLLLLNSSESNFPPLGYSVKFVSETRRGHFVLEGVTMSQSGNYSVEGWKNRSLIDQKSFHLTVCTHRWSKRFQFARVSNGESLDLCESNTTAKDLTTIQVYKRTFLSDSSSHLVVDTNSTLEVLSKDLKGRLEFLYDRSQIVLKKIIPNDLFSHYFCLEWRGGQCQTLTEKVLSVSKPEYFLYPKDNIALPCYAHTTYPNQVFWTSPNGKVTLRSKDSPEIHLETHMLNGRKTGNYSLVIPSVSSYHSGEYKCMHHLTALYSYHIYSCIRYPTINISISQTKEVLLECAPCPAYAMQSIIVTQWYRKRPNESEALILQSGNKPVLPPVDLTGRLHVLESHLTLLRLTVTSEDAGVFRCRVWSDHRRTFCHERIIILQNVNNFYMLIHTALISCALLTLVSIVIAVCVKRGGGHQVYGKAKLQLETSDE